MYLPLTGYTEKEKRDYKMSIDSALMANSIYALPRPAAAPASQPEAHKIDLTKKDNDADIKDFSGAAHKPTQDSTSIDSMSTEDFVILRAQTQDEPFAVLDDVIQRMKENMEELGEAIETMAKLTKEVSKERIALKLLKATFDAIDEIRAGPGGAQ